MAAYCWVYVFFVGHFKLFFCGIHMSVLHGPDEPFEGPHTNVRQEPFLIRIPRILSLMVHFSSPKTWLPFLERTSTQRDKKLAVDREPPGSGGGGPFHGTTGTMNNPALGSLDLHIIFTFIIERFRHFVRCWFLCGFPWTESEAAEADAGCIWEAQQVDGWSPR